MEKKNMNQLNSQIKEAFNYRYACKAFNPNKKISEEDFQTIIESGTLSPSSFGFEPWKFLVVQNEEIREKLKQVSWGGQGQIPTASHFVVILARKANDVKYGSDYINKVLRDVQRLPEEVQKMKGDFFENFQLNDFDLNDERKLFDWASKQTYIALANMMTSSALLGIDSCPMEGFNRTKFEEVLENEGLLDREHFGVSVLVAFGYRTEDAVIYPKTRGTVNELVQWVK
jgi:nitroreductase